MTKQSEAKDVHLTLNANPDENGIITLDIVYTGTEDSADSATVYANKSVTWIAGENVTSIDRIYKDNRDQPDYFSTQPYPVNDKNTKWTGVVGDITEKTKEAYTINFTYIDGNRIWQDPRLDIDPDPGCSK